MKILNKSTMQIFYNIILEQKYYKNRLTSKILHGIFILHE